jgi:nucleotide-binding universal stress UspA family protein
MKILLAADGSKYTKKALAFLVTHESLLAETGELHVINVQPEFPHRVAKYVGKEVVENYRSSEAEKVLAPIRKFLQRHPVKFSADYLVGLAAEEIIKASKRDKSHLIVMGTHGHGVLGRILLGSVAQRVVSECQIPILLVK